MENKNYNRFQVTMHLFNNFSQKTPKFGENICEKNWAVALRDIFATLLHFVILSSVMVNIGHGVFCLK